MYYTRLLIHSKEANKMEESPVQVSQCLEKTVPDFFNRSEGDGYVHVLIICSDSKDTVWNDSEFKAKFYACGNQSTELLSAEWERDKRSKWLCVHIDKDLHAIPDAIKEVLQAVTTCYGDAYTLSVPLEDFLDLFESRDSKAVSICGKILKYGIDNAIEEVRCKRTLFARIILPEKCFEELRNRCFPPFIEYVVLGQLQDPKIQELEIEVNSLKNQIEKLTAENRRLAQEKEQLKSDYLEDNTVSKTEVDKLVNDYRNQIYRLMAENNMLKQELAEISKIIETDRIKRKIIK